MPSNCILSLNVFNESSGVTMTSDVVVPMAPIDMSRYSCFESPKQLEILENQKKITQKTRISKKSTPTIFSRVKTVKTKKPSKTLNVVREDPTSSNNVIGLKLTPKSRKNTPRIMSKIRRIKNKKVVKTSSPPFSLPPLPFLTSTPTEAVPDSPIQKTSSEIPIDDHWAQIRIESAEIPLRLFKKNPKKNPGTSSKIGRKIRRSESSDVIPKVAKSETTPKIVSKIKLVKTRRLDKYKNIDF